MNVNQKMKLDNESATFLQDYVLKDGKVKQEVPRRIPVTIKPKVILNSPKQVKFQQSEDQSLINNGNPFTSKKQSILKSSIADPVEWSIKQKFN